MDAWSSLDSWIAEGRSFAVYRIPGEESPRLVVQHAGHASLFYRMEDLNQQKGFVIAPFRISRRYPIVLIRADDTAICTPDDPQPQDGAGAGLRTSGAGEAAGGVAGKTSGGEKERECAVRPAIGGHSRTNGKALPAEAGHSVSEPADFRDNVLYTTCFRTFAEPLVKGEIDKLVLSRRQQLPRPAGFSPAVAFLRACRRYTHSYVYLCHTPRTGTWLGSTPEIILSGKDGAWQTVALAGTQRFCKGMHLDSWDEKNRKEQQIVASYIRHQLGTLAIRAAENGPYPAKAGELAHLKSEFRFALSGRPRLGDLLGLLHPTPAVCGLPKEKAYRFILDNEGYERRYYSGFIGWMDPGGETDLYVNLRCTHIGPASFTLYAGGGLLASSQLEEEWQETEDKLQTMKAVLFPAAGG